VVPVGELDLGTVGQVHDALVEVRRAGFTDIVLDLRQLTFLDSTGVRLVLGQSDICDRDRAHVEGNGRRLAADGQRFGLIAGPREVQRVFEVCGVVERLAFRPAP